MLYAELAGRTLLALVLAAAVVGKVRGRAGFAAFTEGLRALRVVPRRLSAPGQPAARRLIRSVAVGAIATEALAVVLLVVPAAGSAGLVLSAALLTAFTVILARALRSGTAAGCACFGAAAAEPVRPRHLVRNGVLLAVALAATAAGAGAGGGPVAGAGHPAGVAMAVLTGAVCATAVIQLDSLAELFKA